MNSTSKEELKKLLLPFYFGALTEEERLCVEREMLSDAEVVLDYLDLKRQVEAAKILSPKPSASLWEKIRPKTATQKRVWYSASIGAALAAGLLLFFIFRSSPRLDETPTISIDHTLFDSSSELPASSSVL